MKPTTRYCAIYTRKSSEEGLEQEFNSLDAQREACQAYIISQKAEGWTAVKDCYDDGGFSGGNMTRPALKKLMDDIQAGRVQIVVVYKIDRLTRSLMDFAKLVEIFDKYGVTFVSVTQSFNTTTSMGRLTLNVLLSFAQFEREVTGERIRDKISASKKKGMWMGGMVPFGYDKADKKLVVNTEDAKVIRLIFEQYLILGSVRELKEYLDVNNIISKIRNSDKGHQWGGAKFSRGLLYKLLCNPVYVGRIKHKDLVHEGQHQAILSLDVWDQVQALMLQQSTITRGIQKSRPVGNLLRGVLFDVDGNKYSPSFTNKGKCQYRYYVSQAVLQDRASSKGIANRLSAHEIEVAIEERLKELLRADTLISFDSDEHRHHFEKLIASYDRHKVRRLVTETVYKVVIGFESVQVLVDRKKLLDMISGDLKQPVAVGSEDDIVTIMIPIDNVKLKTGSFITEPKTAKDIVDPFNRTPQELKNWVRGVIWRDSHFAGMTIRQIAQEAGCSESHVSGLIAESFTAV